MRPSESPKLPEADVWIADAILHGCVGTSRRLTVERERSMKRVVLLLVSLLAAFLFAGCGPSAAEKRSQQVAQAKDDALKLRQKLAQAKSGADAENVRRQMMKVLDDASLTPESIHFSESELADYVKAA